MRNVVSSASVHPSLSKSLLDGPLPSLTKARGTRPSARNCLVISSTKRVARPLPLCSCRVSRMPIQPLVFVRTHATGGEASEGLRVACDGFSGNSV